jgi:hypothetical protein
MFFEWSAAGFKWQRTPKPTARTAISGFHERRWSGFGTLRH